MNSAPVYLLNSSFQVQAVFDGYESAYYTRSLYRPGKFELRINYNKPNANLFARDLFVLFGGDSRRVGIITSVKKKLGKEGKIAQTVYVSGYELRHIFERRITIPPVGQEAYTNKAVAETVIKSFLANQCIGSSDANRNFTFLAIAADSARGPQVEISARLKNVGTTLWDICEQTDVGIKITASGSTGIVDTVHGVDRRSSQSVNPRAIFSVSSDTAGDGEITDSDQKYRNLVYAAGQGEGTGRTILEVYSGGEPTGLARREMYLDARDLASTADLQLRAENKLAEFGQTLAIDAEALQYSALQLGTDYDLGDLCTIEALGVTSDVRITEVKEAWAPAKYEISLSFGKPQATITQQVAQIYSTGQSIQNFSEFGANLTGPNSLPRFRGELAVDPASDNRNGDYYYNTSTFKIRAYDNGWADASGAFTASGVGADPAGTAAATVPRFRGNLSADPSADNREGDYYYNTTSQKLRAYQSGVWVDATGKIYSEAEIDARVTTKAPRYLGRYLASHPASYNNGDWWTVYDSDDSPIQRGVWYSNAGAPTRITTGSSATLQGKLVEALTDVAWAEDNGYGAAADYGIQTLFQSLGVVTAFIQRLFAQQITLLSNGVIQSDGYLPGVTGLRIDADGDAEFGAVSLRGSLVGDVTTDAFSSQKAASLPTWTSPASYTGASFYTHFSSLALYSRYKLVPSVFGGNTVVSIERRPDRILVYSVGPTTIANNATLYTLQGTITVDSASVLEIKAETLPDTDSVRSIGSVAKRFLTLYSDNVDATSAYLTAIVGQGAGGTSISQSASIDPISADTYSVGGTRRYFRGRFKELRDIDSLEAVSGTINSLSSTVSLLIPGVNGGPAYLRFDRSTNRLQYSLDGSTWANVNTGL